VADAGMYVAKHAGGNRVSTSDAFGEGMVQRQLVSSYIEGFLQREQNGPEDLQELVALCANSVEAKTGKIQGNPGGGRSIVARGRTQRAQRGRTWRAMRAVCRHDCARLKLSDRQVADVTFAGRIHDVGKLFIPVRILNKSGALTEDEFSAIKTTRRPERKWLE